MASRRYLFRMAASELRRCAMSTRYSARTLCVVLRVAATATHAIGMLLERAGRDHHAAGCYRKS